MTKFLSRALYADPRLRIKVKYTLAFSVDIWITITPLVRHFVQYNLSAPSAFTISFCHSSSAPLISFTPSISLTPSLFSHLSHFYLFSLSFYFFHLAGGNEGKESASKTQRKVSLYLSCSAVFLVKG